MYREIIYFCAELLNYWSMTFFGLKLFAKVYEFSVHRNKNVENVVYAVLCLPIAWNAAGNYLYVTYSTLLTYIIIAYMFVLIKILCRGTGKCSISLVGVYILCMRLFDLWLVAVLTEVSKISRVIEIDLIHVGIERVFLMIILLSIYYTVYLWCKKYNIFFYLNINMRYCRLICLYCLFGNGCFSTVYQFNYQYKLIGYWTFYLVCAFVFIGGFLFYMVKSTSQNKEKLMIMRNNMLESKYLSLQKAYNINNTLQHDNKNHLLTIREFIMQDKIEKALDYIQNYINYDKGMMHYIKSGNDVIDIIVNSKITESKEKQIIFSYYVDVIDSVKMENMDLCALLANLLDNAIESCERIQENNKKIYLKVVKKDLMLIVQLFNSISEIELGKKCLFKSNKKDVQLHGWGMKSIDYVIYKYGGTKQYYIHNQEIEFFITLPVF